MSVALDTRMKEFYEFIPRNRLMRRTPVAIRIDGKAFHNFTRGFAVPFDEVLIKSMQETMVYLCANIQGCVLGYAQSDEITLILVDYKTLHSEAWFDYEVQKMVSISASMATMAFSRRFELNVGAFKEAHTVCEDDGFSLRFDTVDNEYLYVAYSKAIEKGAMFDSRCFNIPREEVTNLIYWRQQDATRNSIQMVGRAYFSHKALDGVSNNKIQDMLFTEHGVNWNDFPVYQKRGSCAVKKHILKEVPGGEPVMRSYWEIDRNIPIFVGEGREYIEKLINFESEE